MVYRSTVSSRVAIKTFKTHPLFNSFIKRVFNKRNKMNESKNKVVSVNDINFSNNNNFV